MAFVGRGDIDPGLTELSVAPKLHFAVSCMIK
jgi:hypothetical protein